MDVHVSDDSIEVDLQRYLIRFADLDDWPVGADALHQNCYVYGEKGVLLDRDVAHDFLGARCHSQVLVVQASKIH